MKQELIDRAAAECRAAFAAAPNAKWAWCCHHGILYEELTEPPENRIAYSLANKEIGELVTRLVNFRPVLNDAKLKLLDDDYYVKRKLLNDDYAVKRKPLDDDYAAKLKPLDDDYAAKRKPLDDDYAAKRKPLNDDYAVKRKPLDDDYAAKRKPLDDDYAAKRKPLNDDYAVKRKLLQQPLINLYRQEVPNGTWNGTSIF